jgi:hypothetical protein
MERLLIEIYSNFKKNSLETSQAGNFVFTSSHDIMMEENLNYSNGDYSLIMYFHWQNGEMVSVYPKNIM